MRLWSIHPRYLDRQGLLALWREALLAQAVLKGNTKGYRHHPQLNRFKGHADPQEAISYYLSVVHNEAEARGYRFDASKFSSKAKPQQLKVSAGQISFERGHLINKLERRDPMRMREFRREAVIEPHPLFETEPGNKASWEK